MENSKYFLLSLMLPSQETVRRMEILTTSTDTRYWRRGEESERKWRVIFLCPKEKCTDLMESKRNPATTTTGIQQRRRK